MPNPSILRDRTQIVLPRETVEDLEPGLDEQFTLTVFEQPDGRCRIIGSPLEIREASEFLVRRGIALP